MSRPIKSKLKKPRKGSGVVIRSDSPNVYSYSFTISGKGHFRGSTEIDNLELAYEFVSREKERLYREGKFKEKPEIGLEAAMGKYIEEYVVKKKSPVAIAERLKHYKAFFIKEKKIKNLSELDDAVIAQYVAWRRSTYVKNTERFIKDETIRKELHTINHLNTWAGDFWGVKTGEFTAKLHKKELEKSAPMINILEDKQQIGFFEALPEFLRPPLAFLLHYGLRKKNVWELQTSHILWKSGIIQFRTKSQLKEGKLVEHPITEEAKAILAAAGVTEDTQEDRHVFLQPAAKVPEGKVKPERKPLGDHRKPIDAALKKSGFNRALGQRLSLFRHTRGTELYSMTNDIHAVMDALGHADIKMSQTYAHILQQRKKAVFSGHSVTQFLHSEQKDEK